MSRSVGPDVHRDFCQVPIADGGRARWAGRIATMPEQLDAAGRHGRVRLKKSAISPVASSPAAPGP